MKNPQYLGDAVYIHRDDLNRIVLTTGHHDPADKYCTNVIVLEPEVLIAFTKYLEKMVAGT